MSDLCHLDRKINPSFNSFEKICFTKIYDTMVTDKNKSICVKKI